MAPEPEVRDPDTVPTIPAPPLDTQEAAREWEESLAMRAPGLPTFDH